MALSWKSRSRHVPPLRAAAFASARAQLPENAKLESQHPARIILLRFARNTPTPALIKLGHIFDNTDAFRESLLEI